MAVGVWAGCGSEGSRPDTTPPATIGDLRPLRVSESSVLLTWTAPGDDGDQGAAAVYDMKYVKVGGRIISWDLLATPDSIPVPRAAGSPETLFVGGLLEKGYYFMMKAADEAGNWSERSNVAVVEPKDVTPPAAIWDLEAAPLSQESVRLAWTAPADDDLEAPPAGYWIRLSTTPLTAQTWDTAAARIWEGPVGPAGSRVEFVVRDLDSGRLYYFAVRAYDRSGNLGAMSNVVAAATVVDEDMPSVVVDLRASAAGAATVVLEWTAPGDDGGAGPVSSYDIRYALEFLTPETWARATPVSGRPIPRPAGSPERLIVDRLVPNVRYYFALLSEDEAGNRSPLSNIAEVLTERGPGGAREWIVKTDGTGDATGIQAAVDLAASGDVIRVWPGVYHEAIDPGNKRLAFVSEEGAATTVLDGSRLGAAPIIRFGAAADRSAVLVGFTLTGTVGSAVIVEGGSPALVANRFRANGQGIFLKGGAASIVGNVFEDNGSAAEGVRGGAISIEWTGTSDPYTWTRPLVEGNTFRGNEAHFGGAIYVRRSGGTLRANRFEANRAAMDGGAVFVYEMVNGLVIESNAFHGNVAGDRGGAIATRHFGERPMANSNVRISRNTMWENRAEGAVLGSSGGAGGAIHASGVRGTIDRNTIATNGGAGGCSIGGIVLSANRVDPERPGTWIIERNIIAFNADGDFGCFDSPDVSGVRDNLLHGNAADIGCGNLACESRVSEANLFADPLFCDPGAGDFRVASDSPALADPARILGAHELAACGPRSGSPAAGATLHRSMP